MEKETKDILGLIFFIILGLIYGFNVDGWLGVAITTIFIAIGFLMIFLVSIYDGIKEIQKAQQTK